MHHLSYILPAAYNEKLTNISIQHGKAINYTFSAGYLLLPFKNKSYKQTNLNLYAEFIGKKYEGAIIKKANNPILIESAASLEKVNYIELRPGFQLIFRSNFRIDITSSFAVYNKSYARFYPAFYFNIQRYFFFKKEAYFSCFFRLNFIIFGILFMYNHFSGKLIEKSPTHVVIECGGVGYELQISLNTFSKLADADSCKLFAEQLYVRDSLPRSFGFYDTAERELFRKLVSVSGVGGTTALIMLSSMSADEIAAAINTADVARLKGIKGIGEKTAQRIIVDLKGKFGKDDILPLNILQQHNKTREDALIALLSLGFAKNIAEKALDKVVKTDPSKKSVEQLIKDALKNL